MKKKKVQAPVYEEMQDTPWITGLRKDLPTYRKGFNKYLKNLDVLSPEVQQKYQDIANDYTQAQWNDFNRNALANYKAMNQANYNRFGNMGSSGAMYNNDTYNRQLNDLATRITGQTAGQYQNLINNYYNQKLNTLNAYNTAYGNAGQQTYGHDQQNWNIRNRNIEAKYAADVQNANNGGGWNWGNMFSGAASGAATGAASGGGWIGALAGGVLGGVTGGLSGNSSGTQAAQLGSSFGNLSSQGANWLNNKWNQNSWNPSDYGLRGYAR